MMAPFSYRPLDRSKNEIRLIHILPAPDPDSEVECNLVHVSLDEQHVYQALSYTWGSNVFSEHILLDGAEFAVTDNLKSALRGLRDRTVIKVLWVDAICINQNDVTERNNAVLRILKIYQRADQVCIWLGDAKDNSGLALDHLEQLAAEWDSFRTTKYRVWYYIRSLVWLLASTCQLCWILTYTVLHKTSKEKTLVGCIYILCVAQKREILGFIGLLLVFYRCMVIFVSSIKTALPKWWTTIPWLQFEPSQPAPSIDTVHDLTDLFQRPWWTRTWTIQEVVAAQKAIVMCGPRRIALTELFDAAYHISYRVASRNTSTQDPYINTPYQRVISFGSVLELEGFPTEITEGRASLLFLMNQFTNADATDPRDKVYAFLGLAKDGINVVPDYRKTVAQVYIETAQEIIQKSRNLDILRACRQEGLVKDLPSWVPDWTSKTTRSVSGMQYFKEPYCLNFVSVLSTPSAASKMATFSGNGRHMTVYGIFVGSLTGEPYAFFIDSQLTPPWSEKFSSLLGALQFVQQILYTMVRLLNYTPGISQCLGYLARKNLGALGHVFRYWMFAASSRPIRAHPKYSQTSNINAMISALVEKDRRERVTKTWAVDIGSHGKLWAGLGFVRVDGEQAEVGCKIVFLMGAKVPVVIKSMGRREEGEVYTLVGPTTFGASIWDTLVWEDIKKRSKNGEFHLERIELV